MISSTGATYVTCSINRRIILNALIPVAIANLTVVVWDLT